MRGPLGRMLMAAAAVLATLLLVEAGLRLLCLQSDPFYQPDRHLGWIHRPGARGTYVAPHARSPVIINQLGLMGPERSSEKPAGKQRLLLLGDSFTESLQVPYEKSWAHLLEVGLGPDWEVLNAGVAGYGTDNELLYLREKGLALQPDIVLLLFFTGNDISDNDHEISLRIGGVEPKPYFILADETLNLENYPLPAQQPGPLTLIKGLLRDHSRLYLFVRTRRNLLSALAHRRKNTGDDVPLAWHVYRKNYDLEWERAWGVTAALLMEIKKTAESNGAGFMLASLPTGWRIEPAQRRELISHHPSLTRESEWDFDVPDRRLSQQAESAGIPYLCLTGPLLSARQSSDTPLFDDHLTAEGHRVVSRMILEFVREQDSSHSEGR